MKVATVTVHSAISYGAMWQAYALRQALEQLGVDAEILDYRNQMIENKNKVIPVRAETNFKRRIKDIVSAPLRYDRNRKFKQFMNTYMRLSPKMYRNIAEMQQLDQVYDAFFVGSDQVWNTKHADFDPVYFLQFVGDIKKRNSYAASFGFAKIPEELKGEYKQRLKDFNGISVRESSGVDIIHELLDRRAERSLDPTLLLDKEDWQKIARAPRAKGYVLLYEVNQASRKNHKLAKKIATEKGLKVVSVTQSIRSWQDLAAHQTGPEGLLGYIENADYILTDSFHGTVFSILFERPFIFCKNDKADVNIRMEELLDITGLGQRADENSYDADIDWSVVRRNLKKRQEGSLRYLRSILGEQDDTR